MTKVYVLIEDFSSDEGYGDHTQIIGVYESYALAKFFEPQEGRSTSYRVQEMELRTKKSCLEDFEKKLQAIEDVRKMEDRS